ncbi:hypothetical protein L1987_46616 [Smallanthus sonchifolius]|uniref:Uncharacterized protein n=1 Tax=Smallanthus sonchifolius TaxID=185202 RepID=A0ACB9G0T7_9ASTR|nr:hypothetical protein L1987_46616 [Smallanthus sonchifolius]
MNFKSFLLLFLFPVYIYAECTCEESYNTNDYNKNQALKFKFIAIASILVAGAVGICIPQFGKMFESFSPESIVFLVVKFFAAGVILATGFVHVFPDANESLENPCLGDKAWGFSLSEFCRYVGRRGGDDGGNGGYKRVTSMLIHKHPMAMQLARRKFYSATGLFRRAAMVVEGDWDCGGGGGGSEWVGGGEGFWCEVLEIGIIIHSVIIGISLGVSTHPKTIKPLIAALSFHQMFEGIGLGSCITEAKFKVGTVATMLIFFSLTTPIGIAIGIGISNTYDENSRVALIIQGILNAASAGILICMALVDLIAVDFMKSKVQTSARLQTLAFISILLGLGCMSLLAKWA